MSEQRVSTIVRVALWRAYERRCFFCETPVAFADVEIDHLIPESLTGDGSLVADLVPRLGLPSTFNVTSLRNLVPTHARCNRRKGGREFSEASLLFFFELTGTRLRRVESELERLMVQAANERVLAALAVRVERGLLSVDEVLHVLSIPPSEPPRGVSEPLVMGVSVNVIDLQRSDQLPKDVPPDYPQLCDWLERDLLTRLRAKGPTVVVACEASARNGETLGVRLASWAFDVNRLPDMLAPWWTVVELAPFSEIYESPPDSLFLKALVQTANRAVRTGDPLRPWACCPVCGSKRLSWDHSSNYHLADHIYYFVKCLDCSRCEEFK
jgi:hypothetical protein